MIYYNPTRFDVIVARVSATRDFADGPVSNREWVEFTFEFRRFETSNDNCPAALSKTRIVKKPNSS